MQPLAPLPDHDADHDQPTGAPAPILLDVTVPRFTGMAGIAVRAILGAVDLAALFEAARVGPVAPTADHSTFRLALDDGLEAGGTTRQGPIAIGNDGGQLRLTLPRKWAPALALAGYRATPATALNGASVCQTWITPKEGEGVTVPIPLGKAGRYRLEVRVVAP